MPLPGKWVALTIVAVLPLAAPQQPAAFFNAQNPRMESRIFGASANFRNQALEVNRARYPEPFRLLIAGDDHAAGCGWKSYPPHYSYQNCSAEFDEGFRIGVVNQIRAATGFEINTVGSQEGPLAAPAFARRHEGRPGLRIDEVAAAVDWKGLAPDVILLLVGTNDVLQLDTAAAMEARYEAMLVAIYAQVPNARVIVGSTLDMTGSASAEVRHNLKLFRRLLPVLVARRRAAMMEVFFVETASLGLCGIGSGTVVPSKVPKCSTGEQNPTVAGYASLAALFSSALEEAFALDGNCRFHPLCQDTEVRKWRNQIDGGLRVVSSYS